MKNPSRDLLLRSDPWEVFALDRRFAGLPNTPLHSAKMLPFSPNRGVLPTSLNPEKEKNHAVFG